MEVLELPEPNVEWERPRYVENLRTRVRIGAKGRLVIPAAIREKLGIKENEVIDLRVEDGELRVVTLRETIRRVQEQARKYVKPSTLVSEELSAERREAAKNE